jgi:predicted nucleotidyltransferase component of viral defense system
MAMNIQAMLGRYDNMKITEQTKIREILQQTALLGLERQGFFEKGAFYGGTALRILFGLNRFSEDLDFTLLKPDSKFDFRPFLDGMLRELASFGFEMEAEVKKKSVETSVVSAFLKGNTLKIHLAIGEGKRANHNEKIQIKLEIDTDPPPRFRLQNKVVLNPVSFNVLTLHLSDLFAGKMHAILYRAWKGRVKGRDWYDLIWYLQNRIPISLDYLEARMKQAGHLKERESLSRNRLLESLAKKIAEIDWESAKADLRPFIADINEIKIWSPQYFLDAIHYLKVE